MKFKKEKKNEDVMETKGVDPEIRKLMIEIDTEVKKLVDIFRFVLKYRIVFRGRGVEFAGIRKYLPTDDASLIDWKVSARMSTSGKLDKLYVKIYEEERDLDVIILLDVSDTMLFGTQEKLKSEYAMLLTGTIAHAAIDVGDNTALIMFNEGTKKLIPPAKGALQYFKILKELVDKDNWGGKKDVGRIVNEIVKTTTNNRTFLFIISDFISTDDSWQEDLQSAVAKFDGVLGIMVRDLRDSELPEDVGNFRFSNPFDGSIVTDTNIDKVRERFNKLAREQEEMIERMFKQSGAGFIKYRTDQTFVVPIMEWFSLWGAGRG